jgi:hypothetical protein
MYGPRLRWASVYSHREVGAGEHAAPFLSEYDFEAEQSDLERGVVLSVAQRHVAQPVGKLIHRPGYRDASCLISPSSHVLDEGQGARFFN